MGESDDCVFCGIVAGDGDARVVWSDDIAVAFLDRRPLFPGHTLVVPRRHAATIFDLPERDYDACFRLVREVRRRLAAELDADAFNVGVNCGAAAGQTVPHAHIHVIPRRPGDVEDPTGGVRNVIPGKGRW